MLKAAGSQPSKACAFALLCLAWLAISISLCVEAQAEVAYPSRAIRIVTPLAAGAASDVALRILAEKLSDRLGVPVLVQISRVAAA
jgi:tripartite-type tricarboxylate transporter receptor subunit TctC